MHKLLPVAIGLAVLAGPAAAQTGLRVEGLIGYDNQQGPFPGDAGKSSGLMYGLAAGYDISRGRLTIGPEVELTTASTDTRGDDVVADGDRVVIESGRDFYIGGRAGISVTPLTLVYGKLGYTNARFEERYSGSAALPAYERGRDADGVRVGAGVEVSGFGNSYIKGEYRYSEYSGDSVENRHQLVAGFGFRF